MNLKKYYSILKMLNKKFKEVLYEFYKKILSHGDINNLYSKNQLNFNTKKFFKRIFYFIINNFFKLKIACVLDFSHESLNILSKM